MHNNTYYQILVSIPTDTLLGDVTNALQIAYDAGAAGQFRVLSTAQGTCTVVFQRDTDEDDGNYLIARMRSEKISAKEAAVAQLMAELEDGAGPAVTTVLAVFRASAEVIDFNEVLHDVETLAKALDAVVYSFESGIPSAIALASRRFMVDAVDLQCAYDYMQENARDVGVGTGRPVDHAAYLPRLAGMFSHLLRQVLSPDELAEVVRRNAVSTEPGVCASHDFCDANQVMLSAFTAVFKRDAVLVLEPGADEAAMDRFEKDSQLVDRAWTEGRNAGFTLAESEIVNSSMR